MKGKLIIFSAPSGSGKTSIVKEVLKRVPNLEFSVSACSRAKRPHEVDGKDYYFISAEQFREKIDAGEFLEWEEVYEDNYYGTLKSEVERIWQKGNHVIFDVDVIGGLNIKRQYKENALSVFVKPPSIDELKNRLLNRATETQEALEKRLDKAEYEMKFAPQFDLIIVNDDLEDAVELAAEEVQKFIS
ncbi:MAG: guanylate kinase [Bacteroidales bacterium]